MIRFSWIPVIVAVAMLISNVTVAEEAPTQTLDDIIKAMAARIKTIDSIEEDAVWLMEFEMQGMKQKTEMPIQFFLQKPDKLFISAQHITATSDGTNLYTSMSFSKQYKKTAVKESLAKTIETALESGMLMISPDKRAVISDDPEAVLRDLTEEYKITLEADQVLNNAPCWVVLIKMVEEMPWPPEATAFRVWINQEYGLVDKIELIREATEETPDEDTEEDEEPDYTEMLKHMDMSVELKRRTVNETISPDKFVFTPAAGHKEVEDFEFSCGGQKDAAQFPLSGKPAPDFDLELLDGTSFKLSEASADKVVVIDFWATWCGPCVRALPKMKEIADAYADKDVLFVGVSRDQASQKEQVAKMLEKHGVPYACGIDKSKIGEAYKVRGIPCIILIDKKGIVQGRHVGFSPGMTDTLKAEIDKLLAGEQLASAVSMSDEEIAEIEREAEEASRCISRQAGTPAFDSELFTKKWEVESEQSGTSHSRSLQNIALRIASPYIVVSSEKTLSVLSRTSGDEIKTISLPENILIQNDLHKDPWFGVLRGADGLTGIAVQALYEKVEDEDDTFSYHSKGTNVKAFNEDGVIIWEETTGESFHPNIADVIPISDEKDLLLVASYNSFRLYDANGKQLLDQRLAHTDVLEITDHDANGLPEFTVIGPKSTCYELKP